MSTNMTQALSFGTVTEYLSWDHDRLDALLASAGALVESGRLHDARAIYAGFRRGLERHIRIEEDLLFPVFEARSGIVDGPTAVMREEHRLIRRALALMGEALEADSASAFREGRRFLDSVLPAHNAKEEHVLYPTTDRLLTESERAVFSGRLQRE